MCLSVCVEGDEGGGSGVFVCVCRYVFFIFIDNLSHGWNFHLLHLRLYRSLAITFLQQTCKELFAIYFLKYVDM